MGLETGASDMSDAIVTPETIRRLKDGEIARRALKWMMEHRCFYDSRMKSLRQGLTFGSSAPLPQPEGEIALYLFELSREVDLEAGHAG